MGGIGKTRIAREVAFECKQKNLFKVAWISTSQIIIKNTGSEYSPAFETVLDRIAQMLDRSDLTKLEGEKKKNEISSLLRSNPVLLVFDNMESLYEEQEKTAKDLISLFSGSISKIIFTSRIKFSDQDYPIYLKKLEGLDVESGVSLIRKISEIKEFELMKNASYDTLAEITQNLGGLPLALNLAISQVAGAMDLDSALDGFKDVSFSGNDDDYSKFYKFIFLNSWKLINFDCKKVLSTLAERPEGAGETIKYLKFATNLSDKDLRNAINENWKYAFVEIQQPTEELGSKIYSLHALTRNFVRTDILDYPK
jgi:NB-ARC domain